MQGADSGDSFVVDLNGVKLSDGDKMKLASAIQGAALSALAAFDAGGDHVAIAFSSNGGTQGITIYERRLLEAQLPELRATVEKLRPGR